MELVRTQYQGKTMGHSQTWARYRYVSQNRLYHLFETIQKNDHRLGQLPESKEDVETGLESD